MNMKRPANWRNAQDHESRIATQDTIVHAIDQLQIALKGLEAAQDANSKPLAMNSLDAELDLVASRLRLVGGNCATRSRALQRNWMPKGERYA